MYASSSSSLNFTARLALRWMFKAFLTGMFLGAGAGLVALLSR